MTKLTKRDEVEDFVGNLRGAVTVDRGTKFENALFGVLMQIWDDIKEEVHKIGAVIFADASSLFLLYCPHIPSKEEVCIVQKIIIFFPDSLCDESEAEIKRTIAHEFAHFILGHEGGASSEEHKKGEKAADDLATKWGFPKREEVRKQWEFTKRKK